jgi:hypothetical protein
VEAVSKYQRLQQHLANLTTGTWTSSFSGIEEILGFPLPKSARTYQAWWSNSPSSSRHNTAWLDVGWVTENLSLAGEQITFRRQRSNRERLPVTTRERTQNHEVTNKDRVSRALDELRRGLIPFVERELQGRLGDNWAKEIDSGLRRPLARHSNGRVDWDNYALLRVIDVYWERAFKEVADFSREVRSYVIELVGVRNRFAHEKPFSLDDTHRALDTTLRLLVAIGARTQAEEVAKAKKLFLDQR